MKKKVPATEVPAVKEPAKKSENEIVLDTLLKISETVIATQKTINEIQKMQRAGRF